MTGNLLGGTTYNDTNLPSGIYTYMVRGVRLDTYYSGSYYNPSQGIFATVTVPNAPPAITVQAARSPIGVVLTWNAQSATTYQVMAKDNFNQSEWSNLSGSIMATGSTGSWTDTNISSSPQRFYCIATP